MNFVAPDAFVRVVWNAAGLSLSAEVPRLAGRGECARGYVLPVGTFPSITFAVAVLEQEISLRLSTESAHFSHRTREVGRLVFWESKIALRSRVDAGARRFRELEMPWLTRNRTPTPALIRMKNW
jgi:hypothetical protein